MEKYDQICHLCCSTIDVKNYLLKINEELTSVGAVLIHILDISKVCDSQGRLCKTYYHTFFALQKAENKLHLRKRDLELKVKFGGTYVHFILEMCQKSLNYN